MFRCLVLCCTVVLSACKSELVLVPSGPSQNGAAGTRLGIKGSATLRTEQTEIFTADIWLADGTSGPAPRTAWSSSDEMVASVSDAGVVTAKQQGSATIVARSLGLSAATPVHVWQNYHGTWMGTYIVRVCAQAVFFAPGWCSTYPTGTSLPFVLTLIQNDAVATGTLTLGSFQGPIHGSISSDRHFAGNASLTALIRGVVFSSSVGAFDLIVDGDTRAGNLATDTRSAELPGSGYFEADLLTVTRVSFTAPLTN